MLNIKQLTKTEGGLNILNNVSLSVQESEVIAIVGPSGGGKSTLLRVINGLDSFSEGSIESAIRPKDIGMIFQHFNLFPHMTLKQNLLYAPLKVHKMPRSIVKNKAMQLLNDFGLHSYANSMPTRLSGGQKQRAAIARALCTDPKLLLLDEPTSALDPENVKEVLNIIKSLAKAGMAMLIVTHEIKFAQSIADRMIFMDHGKILYQDNTEAFFKTPKNARVKQFLEMVL